MIMRSRAGRSSSRWWDVNDDGPGDAAVIVPVRGSIRGLAVGCGVEPALRQDRPLRDGGLRD